MEKNNYWESKASAVTYGMLNYWQSIICALAYGRFNL